MADSVLYASFILRLWREPAVDAAAGRALAWTGELESMQTGRALRLEGLDRLLALVAVQLVGESAATDSAEDAD